MTSTDPFADTVLSETPLLPAASVLRPGKSKVSEALRELHAYRELAFFLAWRDIKVRYKQAVLGVSWAVIQPLFTMVIFTILFGRLANLPSDGLPPAVFYLAGLVPWLYFSSTVTNASMSLIGNADMLTKIYFPRVLLPTAVAGGNLVDFLIGTVIMALMAVAYGVPIGITWTLWPLLMVPLFVLSLGIGMILAALNVRYRDIRYVVPFGIQILLFATPIIYPASLIPDKYQILFALNPLSGLIEGFRYALNPTSMHWDLFAASLATTAAVFFGAWIFFSKSERSFADHV